jgi:hypothetical protein
VQLVPVKGFDLIPAGDETETTTSLAIGQYATLVSHEEDDLRATKGVRATMKSASGLHPIADVSFDIPIDIVEVPFAPNRVARSDARVEQPTLIADEIETERRPQIDSAVRFKDEEPTQTLQTITETLTEPRPFQPDLSGVQLETLPLSPAIVKFAIASVEARAAARAAGRPMPSPLPPPPPFVPSAPPVVAAAPPLYQPFPLPLNAPPPPMEPEPEERSLGVEIAIGLFTFVAVSAPAFWYFFLR